MSIRKREQVERMIEEIEMQHASHEAAYEGDSSERIQVSGEVKAGAFERCSEANVEQ
jgi:hypothetical protein